MAYSRLKCPQCDTDFGQESRLLDHLTDVHGVIDHLVYYVGLHCAGVRPTCNCSPECKVELPWAGWKKGFTSKYARGHNARVDSVYFDKDRQKAFVEKRIEGYATGRNKVWNDGLTKETDERIAIAAEKTSKTLCEGYASGSFVDWRVGNEEKARVQARKSSETKRRLFDAGELVPWNKGLNANTSPEMAAIAAKISATMMNDQDASARRFKPDQLLELITPSLKCGNFTLTTDLSTYRNKYQRLLLTCNVCGSLQEKNLMMLLSTPKCFVCHPKSSVGELQLYEFVKSIAPDTVSCDRVVLPRGLEIDVFVPSHKLAIEYDGLLWHSTEMQDDNFRSQRKMDECAKLGVKFMVIYEDEWRDKRDVIKGMIEHRLGVHSRVLDARKMSIKLIDGPRSRAFFDANHLEGFTPASITCGLVDKSGEIVAAASLRRPFHKSLGTDALELARSCCIRGANVRGWLGRLTRALCVQARESGKMSLVTYVDKRVGTGSGYAAAGWTLVKADTGPRFWWTDYHDRWDRFKYRADSSRGLTQRQVADDAGVVPIYGCSNTLWRRDV